MMRRISIVLAFVLAAAACSSSGEPDGFNQQPTELGDELGEAMGEPATNTLPVVERNFLEGCVLADTPRLNDTANTSQNCTCAFEAIVQFYTDAASARAVEDVDAEAFSLFKNLDENLQDNPGNLPADVQRAVEADNCLG
jgi:hypothetical protein